MKNNNAFTLLELLIALALMSIVLMIAVPNFSQLIKNNRLGTQANEFIISAHLARNEAIKRNLNVILCRSATGTACGGSGGWEKGWIVYADRNNNADLDSGEELKIVQILSGNNTLTGDANYTNSITYRPKGYVAQAGELVLCDDRTGDGDTNDAGDFSAGRAIIISSTGRPRIGKTADSSFTDCSH